MSQLMSKPSKARSAWVGALAGGSLVVTAAVVS
jgi:hypothetical protein